MPDNAAIKKDLIKNNIKIDDDVKKTLLDSFDSLPDSMIPTDEKQELYYYIIKGRSESMGWCWPPLYSEFMFAKSTKELRDRVGNDFLLDFPSRVSKGVESNFLITVQKISSEKRNLSLIQRSLFRECKLCKAEYRIIDKYNDTDSNSPCETYCCRNCRLNDEKTSLTEDDINQIRYHIPVIYRIHNNKTKMSYVGKTTKVFTYRLFQHFYQKKKTKLSSAIFSTSLEDWDIFVLEQIKAIPCELPAETAKRISQREQYWINYYDSIDNGYNMINSTLDTQEEDFSDIDDKMILGE